MLTKQRKQLIILNFTAMFSIHNLIQLSVLVNCQSILELIFKISVFIYQQLKEPAVLQQHRDGNDDGGKRTITTT